MPVRVAAVYDVHGNLPALEAVLGDVLAAAADLIVFGGDLVWGAWPKEVLERARSVPVETHFVKGNMDRALLANAEASFAWSRERLTADDRVFIDSWPDTVTFDVAGLGETMFCHATPRSDREIVLAGIDSAWADAAAGVDAGTVVCGHTHLQFDERHAGRRWVNPGSVGNPTLRPAAWWALLGPAVELRTTEYDTVTAAEAMRQTGFPLPDFADELLRPHTREEHVRKLLARSA